MLKLYDLWWRHDIEMLSSLLVLHKINPLVIGVELAVIWDAMMLRDVIVV